MLPQEESPAESTLLLDFDQSKLGTAYNQLMRDLPIINGQKIMTLCRGTWESAQEITARNRNGHLYVVLGPHEKEAECLQGWNYNPSLTFLYSRLSDLPIPDTFLDRVIIVYSAILFELKNLIIQEVCRVLKPGGIFTVFYFDMKEDVNPYFFEIKKGSLGPGLDF